jgi:hypothetical protein
VLIVDDDTLVFPVFFIKRFLISLWEFTVLRPSCVRASTHSLQYKIKLGQTETSTITALIQTYHHLHSFIRSFLVRKGNFSPRENDCFQSSRHFSLFFPSYISFTNIAPMSDAMLRLEYSKHSSDATLFRIFEK